MTTIRPLDTSDHDTLRQLYLGAPLEDRRTRFCARVSDEHVLRHVARSVSRADTLLGAFEADGLIGAAEVFVGDGSAELAFLVARRAQQQGVGKALMAAALAAARRSGARKGIVITGSDNRPMHRLALSSGMKRMFADQDEWMAEIDLPRSAWHGRRAI
jgi:GNAT superfamily N-acetyltransferase